MRSFITVVGIILFLTLVGVSCSYINFMGNVASAPARVGSRVLETDNILNTYNGFFATRAAYQTKLRDIETYSDQIKTEEDVNYRRILTGNVSAMRSVCRTLANKYNADSEKLTTRWFQDNQLEKTLSVEACG